MLQIKSPAAQIKTFGHAHTGATEAKVPVTINARVLIPLNTKGANERNAYVYEAEASGFPKAAGAIAVGASVYWNGTAVTTTATDNTLIGVALEASESGDTETGLVAYRAF